jgi:hypothetical protein
VRREDGGERGHERGENIAERETRRARRERFNFNNVRFEAHIKLASSRVV